MPAVRKDGRDATMAAAQDCARVLATNVNGGGYIRSLYVEEITQVLLMLAIRFKVKVTLS